VLAACGNGGADNAAGEARGWADEIARLYQEATTDFTRQILSDGVITSAEAQEARMRVNECLAQHDSLVGEMNEEGATEWMVNPDIRFPDDASWMAASDAAFEAALECLARWDAGVVGQYLMMRSNPNNDPWDELTVACLIRHELVPPGFTTADWLAANSDGCEIPDTAEEALTSPCFLNVWELEPGYNWFESDLCPGWCSSRDNILVELNPDHPREPRELPGGIRLDWYEVMTPQERQVRSCQENPLG